MPFLHHTKFPFYDQRIIIITTEIKLLGQDCRKKKYLFVIVSMQLEKHPKDCLIGENIENTCHFVTNPL